MANEKDPQPKPGPATTGQQFNAAANTTGTLPHATTGQQFNDASRPQPTGPVAAEHPSPLANAHDAAGKPAEVTSRSLRLPKLGMPVEVNYGVKKRAAFVTNVPDAPIEDNPAGLIDVTMFGIPELDQSVHMLSLHNVAYDANGERDPSWRWLDWTGPMGD